MKAHQRLREYRAKHGVTQAWVAKKAGISPKTLNGIELGRQRLSVDLLECICKKAFGIELEIFFDDRVLEIKSEEGIKGIVTRQEVS